MDPNHCSFQKLPFSKLFNTYTSDFSKLRDFFEYNPLKDKDIERRSVEISVNGRVKNYLSALETFHQKLGIYEIQLAQRNKMASEGAIAMVTGQQLGVYGGPLFTIYKTITAISLAKQWEEKLRRPVVPVFWLADEDHDFEEISWVGLPSNNEAVTLKVNAEGDGSPVSSQIIPEEIQAFSEKVFENLLQTDFTDQIRNLFQSHYTAGTSYIKAFAGLMSDLFSKHGLLLVGSNTKEIKELGKDVFVQSIAQAGRHNTVLNEQSHLLEKDFHRQVMLGDTNLFYLHPEGRLKIEGSEAEWTAGTCHWSHSELLSEIENHPENFSPNVFLRPILQDHLLPTLGYVAGPGEIAYYGQMKTYYHCFDQKMPVIFPRYSATLLESGIERVMEKLPFNFWEYEQRIEDLESNYVEITNTTDIEAVFKQWKADVEKLSVKPSEIIEAIDPTLKGTIGKSISVFESELDKLKGKVYRSIKHQEETQINRIARVKHQLFPDGGLQERFVNPVYFMNKHGMDIWDVLLEQFDGKSLDKHHIITV